MERANKKPKQIKREIRARFYATDTVCKMLDVSRSWVWEQVEAGRFPKPIKFGRLNRYSVEEIEKYIKEREEESRQEENKNETI